MINFINLNKKNQNRKFSVLELLSCKQQQQQQIDFRTNDPQRKKEAKFSSREKCLTPLAIYIPQDECLFTFNLELRDKVFPHGFPIFSQFHQHFTRSFCANFLLPKNTNLTCKYRKAALKSFG